MATSLPVTSQTANILGGCELILPTANFAVMSATADEAVLSNRLSPLDQEERLTYRSRAIARVDSDLQIRNPAAVRSGVQYQIVLETTARTTEGDAVVDEPIVMNLMVRHPRSGNMTPAIIQQAFRRLIGAVMLPANLPTDTSVSLLVDGRTRFLDLARFAELPTRDSLATGTPDA
jgi:hypothetical protein